MATLKTQGIDLYYELHGDPRNPPVVLLHGLGGSGKSWGGQGDRFAHDYYVILPDQRGVGQTSRAADGYTTGQLAQDTASLLEHLDLGPAHVVGSSTGGAIAQHLALDHAARVRSLTLASSFAWFDPFVRREFALRRKLMAETDPQTACSAYALFLFSPRFARENPAVVEAWVKRAATGTDDRVIALRRIDMIAAHDTRARLGEIPHPTLVICGQMDFCTPLPNSEELARDISGAQLEVVAGAGHLVHTEQEERFFEVVAAFLARH
jgi:aminoacrylate hydrolase